MSLVGPRPTIPYPWSAEPISTSAAMMICPGGEGLGVVALDEPARCPDRPRIRIGHVRAARRRVGELARLRRPARRAPPVRASRSARALIIWS
jgi:hypothetical protein